MSGRPPGPYLDFRLQFLFRIQLKSAQHFSNKKPEVTPGRIPNNTDLYPGNDDMSATRCSGNDRNKWQDSVDNGTESTKGL